ncbi:hypothetical protein ACR820_19445 [Streptomyces netropsis]
MRTYIGGHEVVSDTEFIELALGTPVELWLGEPGESQEERAARLDAARDILSEDPGLVDRAAQAAAKAIEERPDLFSVHRLPARGTARTGRRAVA